MCQCVPRFQSDPVVARDVRSRDDVGPFSQFGKFFGRGLEGNPDRSRFERDNGEHLAANLEQKVVAHWICSVACGREMQNSRTESMVMNGLSLILAEGSGSVLDFTFRSIHCRIGLESTYSGLPLVILKRIFCAKDLPRMSQISMRSLGSSARVSVSR